MTPEDFKNIAQGAQAIFLSVASIIGGVWVLLRFGLTRERVRAQLELERNRADTQRLRDISCEMSIRHAQIDHARFLVYVDATLTNHGSDLRLFRVDDFPFHINRVTIRDGDTWYDEVVRLRIEGASSERDLQVRWPVTLTVLPDTPCYLSFHYELDSPGSYMFSLVLGSEDLEAKSARDKKELERRRPIYDEYKDHPAYRPDPKAELVFDKHCYIGEEWIDPSVAAAPKGKAS
jgi:hypothetical protein